MTDGRVALGEPLGSESETLLFQAAYPARGLQRIPFPQVESISLHDAVARCIVPGDGAGFLRLAQLCGRRGLTDLALRELDFAVATDRGLAGEVDRLRVHLREEAAVRMMEEAREHLAEGRPVHGRVCLDHLLERFGETEAAREARALAATLPSDVDGARRE